MGLDPGRIPVQGTYHVKSEEEPPSKKAKTDDAGFNGMAQFDNAADVGSNTIPLFPKKTSVDFTLFIRPIIAFSPIIVGTCKRMESTER
jgi:hypothetical protein